MDKQHVASCVKHFAAYGAPEAGREYNTVDMSERKLRQDYLPAYKSAVQAGCKMVMSSFNTVDGIPASGNQWLMRKLLREEWGFDGVTVSDYAAIQELIFHGLAEDEYEAAKLGIEAGIDFDMQTPIYAKHLKSLIERGEVEATLIDEAVLRILNLKNELGLFEDPFRGADSSVENGILYADTNRQIALGLAEESIVLLKNENNILPIDRHKKIALVGPYANEKSLVGLWAFTAERDRVITLKQAMESKAGENIEYAYGCDILDDYSSLGELGFTTEKRTEDREPKKDLEEALKKAADADIIVAALGEHTMQSGEAASRTDLTINRIQIEFLERLHQLNKPIVCVVFSGRPLLLDNILDKVDGLVEAWFPGTEGARALANILYGEVNPSGKLTMSFPMNVGQIPVYYNEFKTGRPIARLGKQSKFVSKYLDVQNEPRYPFGFGLSYTEFEYGEIELDSDTIEQHKGIKATITIKNVGKVKGKETIQMYIQDVAGSVVRPVKELKGFQKIELEPGEKREVEFCITQNDLQFYRKNMKYEAEKGNFKLFLGRNSRDCKEAFFKYC